MAKRATPAAASEAAVFERSGSVRYAARQPIMDLRNRVHGYELLFRAGPEAAFRGDGEMATRTMLDNTVIFGMDRLTGGMPAFVNCTQEVLTKQLVHVAPAGQTVLEILETLELTPGLIDSCRELKIAGFRLALDDFVWRPNIEPLVEMADYIKIDFAVSGLAERKVLLAQLKGKPIALVAEKVETLEEFEQARAEGFTLFQGYYFCRPVLMKNGKIPANRLSHIQILEMLQHDPMDLRRLGQAVKRDASLTYRLLRLVNSPMCAMRQEINSIDAALLVVGEETFRRIATVAIASELNSGQPAEILRMAFVRGRFCETAAGFFGLDATEQYLLGMLSLLPAMLRLPMEELTPSLPLRDGIREALKGQDNPERGLLGWLECHERGDWQGSDAILQERALNERRQLQCYADAIVWAEAAMHLAAGV